MQSLLFSRRHAAGFEVYRNTQGTVHLKLFVGQGERSYYLSVLEARKLAQQEAVALAEEGSLLRAYVVATQGSALQTYEIRDEKADGATYTYAMSVADGDHLAQALIQTGVQR